MYCPKLFVFQFGKHEENIAYLVETHGIERHFSLHKSQPQAQIFEVCLLTNPTYSLHGGQNCEKWKMGDKCEYYKLYSTCMLNQGLRESMNLQ